MDERDLLDEFSSFIPDPPKMRDMCWRCSRPAVVCWCSHLPTPPIDTSTNIIILQHPYEEGRRLKTAPMLLHGLAEGRCHIFSGKRFPLAKYPLLAAAVNQPDRCLLMFPSDSALDLSTVLEQREPEGHEDNPCASTKPGYTLILLDGTWFQARGIYGKNQYLRSLKQVKLSNTGLSEYVIRTQPNDASLSTLECAAIALSALEGKPDIKERLVAPLRALCSYQMDYGAVKHHSKQYLIERGLYEKQVSKTQLKKFIETGGNKIRACRERLQREENEKAAKTDTDSKICQTGEAVGNTACNFEEDAGARNGACNFEQDQAVANGVCNFIEDQTVGNSVCNLEDEKQVVENDFSRLDKDSRDNDLETNDLCTELSNQVVNEAANSSNGSKPPS